MDIFKILIFLSLGVTLSCTAKKSEAPKQQTKPVLETKTPKASEPQYEVRHFDTAAAALGTIIQMKQPELIGFGEIHQSLATQNTVSALKRFSETMMPAIADTMSDLVVETWQPVGCGEVEKKVVAEVKEVIDRPKTTENEVVTMIKKAKAMGVQPHILKVACDDYEALFANDAGTMDAYLMLKLIARLLKEKSQEAFAFRAKQTPGKSQKTVKKKAVAIYGGAIHNDPYPEEGWEEVVFGPELLATAKGKYVAIDLYVPEYIEADAMTKEEKWYPIYKQHVSEDKVTLIKINTHSYHMILKQGVATAKGLKPVTKP
jgi:hypothetical protein